MPNKETKIVVLGKSTTTTKDSKRREILKDLDASDVPKEFIDVVRVYLSDGKIIPFEVNDIVDTFSLDELRDFLKEQKISHKVDLVEIYLDMDLIFTKLESTTNNIFKNHFENLPFVVDKILKFAILLYLVR